jgi:3D (Asp-Asp-Asp) domain-containing protein
VGISAGGSQTQTDGIIEEGIVLDRARFRVCGGVFVKRTAIRVAAVLAAIICMGVPQIRAEGTGPAAERSAGWEILKMRVTAYCPCTKCCGRHADGITACGHEVCAGDRFVAADRRYAFGTEMVIPGYNGDGAVKVLDRGGAIRGDRLDVFFNTHKEALKWGVQDLYVKVRTGSTG